MNTGASIEGPWVNRANRWYSAGCVCIVDYFCHGIYTVGRANCGRLIGVLYNDSFKMLHGQESMQVRRSLFFSKVVPLPDYFLNTLLSHIPFKK